MDDFTATMIVEGDWEMAGLDLDAMDPEEVEETWVAACQHLIDTGLAWKLQGSFGRTCMQMIELGRCSPMRGAH